MVLLMILKLSVFRQGLTKSLGLIHMVMVGIMLFYQEQIRQIQQFFHGLLMKDFLILPIFIQDLCMDVQIGEQITMIHLQRLMIVAACIPSVQKITAMPYTKMVP